MHLKETWNLFLNDVLDLRKFVWTFNAQKRKFVPQKVVPFLTTKEIAIRILLVTPVDYYATVHIPQVSFVRLFLDIDIKIPEIIQKIVFHPIFQDAYPIVVETERGFQIHYFLDKPTANRYDLIPILYSLSKYPIDFICSVDMSRLGRIPLVYSTKYGKKWQNKIWVKKKDNGIGRLTDTIFYPDAIRYAKNKTLSLQKAIKMVIEDEVQNFLDNIKLRVKTLQKAPQKEIQHKYWFHPAYLELMLLIIKRIINDEDIHHFERFSATAFLLRIGWSPEEIHELFKVRSDYLEKMTTYQINQIMTKGYYPPSYRKLKNFLKNLGVIK